MGSILTRRIARYGVAVLVSAGALLLRQVLMASLGTRLPQYIILLPAVMLTAVLCGLGPGLLATGVAALLADYWLLPPAGFGIQDRTDAIGLGVFTAMGIGMSGVAELYHRAERLLRARTAELSRAVATLERQAGQLRSLASELTLAEQRERRRLSEILHGDLQQLLIAVKLGLSPLEQAPDPRVREAYHEALPLLGQALTVSRSLTEELSPPKLHRGDLVGPLTWLARWMGEKHRLAVVVRASAGVVAESEDTASLIFQAIRELLLNVVKYAHVDTAQVELARQGDQVQIVVSDAGVGFDPSQLRALGGTVGGFGLFSLGERLELLGGRMEIESAPRHGSRVRLWVPLQRATAPHPSAATSGTFPPPRNAGPPSA